MADLHRTAYPEPADDTTPPPATVAEAAKARINELRNDPEFIKRIEEGDPAARAELADLDAKARPEPLPFTFSEDVPIAEVEAANVLARSTAESMGVAPELARGAVSVLERAHAERLGEDGVPKPMDDLELAKLESTLHEKLGDNYDAAMDNVEAALKRAGKGGAWLQKAILAAGPTTAAWAFMTLAGLPEAEQ